MKGKLIHLSSHHLVSSRSRTKWADVWVRFTSRPGRRQIRLGPCINGREDLETMSRWDEKEGHPPSEETKAILAGNKIVVSKEGPEDIPEIHHPAAAVTRKEAEEAIAFWLKEKFGIAQCRFRWDRSKYRTTPA
jgi:hypothetical protein